MSAPGRHAPLHVAIVAPPWFTVPPRGYGGVENVCADLVTGLMGRGHTVTLVGAGASGTPGRFISTYDEPPSARLGEPLPEVLHSAAAARALADLSPDVVHDHTLAGPLQARGRAVPTVVTMHGPVAGEPGEYYPQLGASIDLVAISAAQRRSAPDLPWAGTVHNAVDVETFPFRADKDDVLLFLGRLHRTRACTSQSTRPAPRACRWWWPGSATSRSSWSTCARTSSRGSGRTSRCSDRSTPRRSARCCHEPPPWSSRSSGTSRSAW